MYIYKINVHGKKQRKKKFTGNTKEFYRVLFCKLQSRCLDIAERSLSQLLATCNAKHVGNGLTIRKFFRYQFLRTRDGLTKNRIRLEEKEPQWGWNTNYVKSIQTNVINNCQHILFNSINWIYKTSKIELGTKHPCFISLVLFFVQLNLQKLFFRIANKIAQFLKVSESLLRF